MSHPVPSTDHCAVSRWDRESSVVFRRPSDPFGGLHNFAIRFPLVVQGFDVASSEALYQALRLSARPDDQIDVLRAASPAEAKQLAYELADDVESTTWTDHRIAAMRWTLAVKYSQHHTRLAELLIGTSGRAIVEESRRDEFWGAVPIDSGYLHGANVLGRLWMEIRDGVVSPVPADSGPFLKFLGTPIAEVAI